MSLHQQPAAPWGVIAFVVVQSFGQYLDIIPVRASKGLALRWFAEHNEIALENIMAAGGSGADADMLREYHSAVVVANRHHEELSELLEEGVNIFFKLADRMRKVCWRCHRALWLLHNCEVP